MSFRINLVIGGSHGRKEGLNAVERFDPRLGRCQQVASMMEHRSGASAVELKGNIYVSGGYLPRPEVSNLGAINCNSLATVEMFAYFINLQLFFSF